LIAGRERAIDQAIRARTVLPEPLDEVRSRRQAPEAEVEGAGVDETTTVRPPPAPSPPPPSQTQRRHLRRLLSSPGALRRAILLQEILGPPVALRTPDR
jgi:hypothetical protein